MTHRIPLSSGLLALLLLVALAPPQAGAFHQDPPGRAEWSALGGGWRTVVVSAEGSLDLQASSFGAGTRVYRIDVQDATGERVAWSETIVDDVEPAAAARVGENELRAEGGVAAYEGAGFSMKGGGRCMQYISAGVGGGGQGVGNGPTRATSGGVFVRENCATGPLRVVFLALGDGAERVRYRVGSAAPVEVHATREGSSAVMLDLSQLRAAASAEARGPFLGAAATTSTSRSFDLAPGWIGGFAGYGLPLGTMTLHAIGPAGGAQACPCALAGEAAGTWTFRASTGASTLRPLLYLAEIEWP